MLQRQHVYQKRIRSILCDDLYTDKKHPLFNFMFSYFHFKPEKVLYQYSPGLDVTLEDQYNEKSEKNINTFDNKHLAIFAEINKVGSFTLDPVKGKYCPEKVLSMRNTAKLLQNSYAKAPSFSCYGLHEWAMLYEPSPSLSPSLFSSKSEVSSEKIGDTKKSKHQNLPLRVTREEIAALIDSRSLRCTHYDALR
jgi:hypothetical protein